MAGEHLVQRVRSALAQGDQAGAIALLRGAGLPAIRQAIGELRALPAEEQRAIKLLLGQAARQAAAGAADVAEEAKRIPRLALRDHPRTPTVEMGEKPGSLRWVMIVLFLLALAAWLAFGGF